MNAVVYARYSSHKQGNSRLKDSWLPPTNMLGNTATRLSMSTLTGHRQSEMMTGSSSSRC